MDRSASCAAPPPPEVLVETRHLYRALGDGEAQHMILHDLSIRIERGQFVALTGASGSGKSTLLYLLGALDRQSQGEVWLDGVEMGALDDDDRAAFRNQRLGFVFQFHFLLPEFSALENVVIPMLRRGQMPRAEAEDRAYEVLRLLDLHELHYRKPGQLSGGAAAARLDRASGGERSGAHPGRRADRKPRLHERRGGLPGVRRPGAPSGADRRHGHSRERVREARGHADSTEGRAGRCGLTRARAPAQGPTGRTNETA